MENTKQIPLDLSVLSEEVIEVLLLDVDAEPSLYNAIAQKNTHRPKILRFLLNHPQTPEASRQFVAHILQVPLPEIKEEETTVKIPENEQARGYRTQSLYQRIQRMRVGEKIQLALRGSRDIRSILIRDSNQEVMLTVLENPKMTESEIELLAKQRTSSDEVLRTIAKKKEWLRKYAILYALATNPKTPVTIAVKNISKLKHKDLLAIDKNRNLSEAVRAIAKKLIATRRQS